jgi:hypothetical protein
VEVFFFGFIQNCPKKPGEFFFGIVKKKRKPGPGLKWDSPERRP